MEKRKFNQAPAADRHMLIDLLVQAGFIDNQGFITEAGEEIIAGDAYASLEPNVELLGTDIKPGYLRLIYRLPERWIGANTKAFQVLAAIDALGWNVDIVAKAVVYIHDRDVITTDRFLNPEIEEQPTTEETVA